MHQMWKSAQKRQPGQFSASGRREQEALAEREKARQRVAENVAGLRALRLAKEAADKKAAKEAADKKAAKGAVRKKAAPRKTT